MLKTAAPYDLHAMSDDQNRLRLALVKVKYHIVTRFHCPLLGNSSINMFMAADTHATIRELLETVLSVQSDLRLCSELLSAVGEVVVVDSH